MKELVPQRQEWKGEVVSAVPYIASHSLAHMVTSVIVLTLGDLIQKVNTSKPDGSQQFIHFFLPNVE